MRLKSIVKLAVATQWLLFPLYFALSFFLEKKLPETLQEYLLWEAERALTTADTVIAIVIIPLIIIYLVSSIGVFLFKRWAKNIYIVITILLISLTPFTGPFVVHEIAATLDGISSVLSGVVLALLLFTSVYKDNTAKN